MDGQNSEHETGAYSVGHGPDKCRCTVAERCPYWIEKLGEELSMSRGLSLGGQKDSKLIYVGGTHELDKLQKKHGPTKPKGHGPQG